MRQHLKVGEERNVTVLELEIPERRHGFQQTPIYVIYKFRYKSAYGYTYTYTYVPQTCPLRGSERRTFQKAMSTLCA
jgi:hypothetical protein